MPIAGSCSRTVANGRVRCPVCGKWPKIIDGYHKNPKTALGIQTHCKKCQISGRRERDRVTQQRAALIKLERGCIDCGYNAAKEALDFDHRPGTVKVFQIAQASGRTWTTVLEEIAKCDVVCANCHRIRTATRRYG